jgi:tetratricopeptide (TPR) repeat protein
MAALAALLWFRRNQWGRTPFFVLAYFLVTLLPVLGFLKMSYMRLTLVADHFQYISNISIIAAGCAAGTLVWRRISPALQPLLVGAAALLVASLTLYSWDRVKIYEGEYTLWDDVLKTARKLGIDASWQAHNHMGAVLFMQRKIPEATGHFYEAVRLKPENPESHNNLGLGYCSQGWMEAGIEEYRRAILIRPWEPSMHTNLGNALGQMKRYAEAAAEYQESIRLSPRDPAAHCNLGYVYCQTGKLDEAIREFQTALSIDPNMQQARINLEAVLRQKGMLR